MNKDGELVNGILLKIEAMKKTTISSADSIVDGLERTEVKLKKIEETLFKIEKKNNQKNM